MEGIGIVGGGKAGLRLLELLGGSSGTSVQFVCDQRSDAPACVRAKQLGVAVFTDAARALQIHQPRLVFEVTGSEEVAAELRGLCETAGIDVVTHEMAALVLDAIAESRRTLTAQVVADVTSIKSRINASLAEMQSLVDSIDRITGDMQMLALNARIEAARVGEAGRGFAVVSQEMAGSTESIRGAARQLEQLNIGIKAVAAGIDAALERLK